MENNMDKPVCGGMCGGSCGGCGGMHGMGGCGCHGGKSHLMKVILKIVIMILIFWCGFKLGVMTGSLQAFYGGGMRYETGYRMMNGGGMVKE